MLDLVAYASRPTKSATDDGHRLKATAWQVLTVLILRGETGEYPGDDHIAKLINHNRSTVWRARDDLERRGMLVISGSRTDLRYELRTPNTPTYHQQAEINRLCDQPVMASPPVAGVPVPESQRASEPASQEVISGEMSVTAPELVPQESPEIRAKTKRISPEVKAWCVASPANMTLYIRFGAAAYQKTLEECEATLKPSSTDWLVFKPADLNYPFFDNGSWKASHYMGYFWHHVCLWRAQRNIPLTMPQWSRLAGAVANLQRTMIPYQAFLVVWRVAVWFDVIRMRLGRLGDNMMLDEASLDHRLVKEQALLLEGLSQDQQNEEWTRALNPQPRQPSNGGEYHVG